MAARDGCEMADSSLLIRVVYHSTIRPVSHDPLNHLHVHQRLVHNYELFCNIHKTISQTFLNLHITY